MVDLSHNISIITPNANVLTSLAIRQVQMKTTMRYHSMSRRMVKLENSGKTKCWWGDKAVQFLYTADKHTK